MFLLISLLTINSFAHEDVKCKEKFVMSIDKYENTSFWVVEPTIVICKDQTIFNIYEVSSVLKVWGEDIKSIQQRQNCNYEHEWGVIKIVDAKLIDTDAYWGYTKYRYEDVTINGKQLKKIKSAVIQIDKNVNNVELLAHEFGHAFGYHHYDKGVDLMNSTSNYSYDYTGKYPY